MITDNGIEYDYTKDVIFEEEMTETIATEYYKQSGEMVRRDVLVKVKEGFNVFGKVGD